jgi:hypothetical protein
MTAWTDAQWLAGAHEWIHHHARALGLRVTGPIEQPHVRPWSTVLRVPTTRGDVWFKANDTLGEHEAAVLSVLAAERPDCAPELLAVDVERGWMLTVDGGERLRDVLQRERDLGRWLDVLPLYARVQLDVAQHAEGLVRRGAPDRRLATFAAQYEDMLDGLEGPAVADMERLRTLAPRVREMCAELAGYGIPETIEHADFHDGHVFVRDGRYLLFDWGDSCIAHPFFTMSVTLEGMLAWGLDDVEGSVDTTRFRDAYLRGFGGYAARRELEAAHAIALRLGWICKALNLRAFDATPELPYREQNVADVAVMLRMFLAGC